MESVKEDLKQTIRKLFDLEIEPEVTVAPANVEADFSSNVAMRMAKELHRAPLDIAKQIAEEMGKYQATVAAPGFLNFISPDEYFLDVIGKYRDDFAKEIASSEYLNETVICEYSDPNPFKVLHVGHLYTSVVGDSLSRFYEYAGAKVIRANFGGDVGLHVAKTIYAILKNAQMTNSSKDLSIEHKLTIEEIAKAYVEGTRAYEEDGAAKKEITKLNKEIYRINKENIREGEVASIYWRGRELSYEYFDDFYAKIGVKFDKYYPESTVADLGLATVKEQLEKGVYELSNGAIVFEGEKFGLHTRVFVNREGVPTYEAKDVGLIFTKWDDYHFDKSIVITGDEQLDYMKVVLKSVEQYAPDLVHKTTHLTHGMVKLPGNEKMSSRKGNFLKAIDVLDMTAQSAGNAQELETLNKNSRFDDLGKNEKKVILAAIKYAFLKYKVGGNIIFDPKESVKTTGNSGVYLLYSAVRAKKILNKISSDDSSKKTFKMGKYEKELIKKIVQYRDILKEAVNEMAPHTLCNYLYSLSQEFSRFYENVQVAGSENEAILGGFVQAYFNVMEHGLGLLGIEIPEEM